MAVNVQPMADYVVATKEKPETKTASGFYLPDKAAEKPETAKVVAVGKDVDGVKAGDRILYKNKYEATDFQEGDVDYVVVSKKNIVAVVR